MTTSTDGVDTSTGVASHRDYVVPVAERASGRATTPHNTFAE